MIEAVIFDWGGTLTPWKRIDHLAIWRAYADVLYPGDEARAAHAAAALVAAEDARWGAVKETSRSFRLADVLADAGQAHSEEALAVYQARWVFATHTDPEAAPLLGALRAAGKALGVLSSTAWPAAWHEEWLRRDGVLDLFDACVWSSDLAWTKPHPEAFGAALAAVGVTDPSRAVYVGDRPYDDISGAKAAGMRAVLVPHSDIPEHQRAPATAAPDAVINRLADLPALLASW